uniref:Spastin n=1 Tax=Schistosoma japonicum TaxID=6182 RepID=C1LGK6_SCHJA|nr:Spastin [Schistosoma japonicum]
MLKTNKEDRAEYIRKILFSQFPERCNAFDVDLLLSEYAELVDNMKNGINNYAEGALRDAEGCKNESNHWRSALTVDMALSALEGVTSKETCILPKQSLPSDFDVAKFCSLLTGLFDGESHVSQVSEPVKNTNVHLSSIGHKRSSIDLVKHSSPKRHLEKAESADFNKKSSNDTEMIESEPTLFQTAGSLLEQNLKVKRNENCNKVSLTYGSSKRSLGSRRGVRSSFVPPFEKDSDSSTSKPTSNYDGECKLESVCDERLKQLDQKIIDMIMSEIMDSKSSVTWDDIAGLEFSKKTLQEIVILPMLRPDLFVGLRGPPKRLTSFWPSWNRKNFDW